MMHNATFPYNIIAQVLSPHRTRQNWAGVALESSDIHLQFSIFYSRNEKVKLQWRIKKERNTPPLLEKLQFFSELETVISDWKWQGLLYSI